MDMEYGIFKINGVRIPTPIKWDMSQENVVTAYSGKATLDGKLHNSVIRTRDTIKVSFGVLRPDELTLLQELISGNTVKVNYPAANKSGYEEKEYIVGSRSFPMLKIIKGRTYWQGLDFTLTEV